MMQASIRLAYRLDKQLFPRVEFQRFVQRYMIYGYIWNIGLLRLSTGVLAMLKPAAIFPLSL
jgi:hypothetical protein